MMKEIILLLLFEALLVFSDQNRRVCHFKPDNTFCNLMFVRYFYNKNTRKCETFIFGGCGGNPNRFDTLKECENQCVNPICDLKPDQSLCDLEFVKYYFNTETERCETFNFGGCGSNPNEFDNEQECKKQCL